MNIEMARTGISPELGKRLYDFYHRVLDPLNAETPLAQVLDDKLFQDWIASDKALKLYVEQDGGIKAFAVLSFDLDHDPLISQPYFAKHFPGRQICHIPAICIDEQFRLDHPGLCVEMVQNIADTVRPLQALGIFFHSRAANPAMPRLMKLALGSELVVGERDAMACVFMEWASLATE